MGPRKRRFYLGGSLSSDAPGFLLGGLVEPTLHSLLPVLVEVGIGENVVVFNHPVRRVRKEGVALGRLEAKGWCALGCGFGFWVFGFFGFWFFGFLFFCFLFFVLSGKQGKENKHE